MSWIYVTRHFNDFMINLQLTKAQRDDAVTKANNIASALRAKYRPYEVTNGNDYLIVGSYGKGTMIRPPTDIDMLYRLPYSTYQRINQVSGNKQSILLQEIKNALEERFVNTDLGADGQVVKVPFQTCAVDVVPAFYCENKTYMICDTNLGGKWKYTNPVSEYQAINGIDILNDYKATRLIWMLKAWKNSCNVDVPSLCIEILATQFVSQWIYRDKSIFWYDWMIRDFFLWLLYQKNKSLSIPGSYSTINLGDIWYSRAVSAYQRALKACDYEKDNYNFLSAEEWQKIFGNQFIAATPV